MGSFLLLVFPRSCGAPLYFLISHSCSLVGKVMTFPASVVSQVLLSHRRKLNQFDKFFFCRVDYSYFLGGCMVGVCVCWHLVVDFFNFFFLFQFLQTYESKLTYLITWLVLSLSSYWTSVPLQPFSVLLFDLFKISTTSKVFWILEWGTSDYKFWKHLV